MVAAGYGLERTINIALAVPCCLLSFYQIYVSSLPSVHLVAKRRIHVCGAVSMFFWILANIDPQGVFEYYPKIFVILFLQYALDALTGALCFIIYSHFLVHYNSIGRDVPKFLAPSLKFSIIWLILMSTSMHCLQVYKNLNLYGALENLDVLIFIFLVLISDLYGYYLIRRVLRELQRAIMENLSAKQLASARNSMTDHRLTLSRIFRFHVILAILLIIELIDRLESVFNGFSTYSNPPSYADPDEYEFNVASIPLFLVWLLETWWAWIPFRAQDNDTVQDGLSTRATYDPQKGDTQSEQVEKTEKFTFNLSDTMKNSSKNDITLENTPGTPSRQEREPDS